MYNISLSMSISIRVPVHFTIPYDYSTGRPVQIFPDLTRLLARGIRRDLIVFVDCILTPWESPALKL